VSLAFVVLGQPIPKARPRVARGHAFTPKTTLQAEARIAATARQQGARPLSCPVRLDLRFYREDLRRVDIDNLVKLVQDALNGIAYVDDAQVVSLSAVKLLDRDAPRTCVEVAPWP
jgi:Holliday junction resolvase RusA-like endonuclease